MFTDVHSVTLGGVTFQLNMTSNGDEPFRPVAISTSAAAHPRRSAQTLGVQMKIPFLGNWLNKRDDRKPPANPYSAWPDGSLAFVSKLCMGANRKAVRFMRRDEPKFAQDSGWVMCSGHETTPPNPADFVVTAIASYIQDDPSLEKPLQAPVGTEWTRKPREDVWLRIVGDDVVDEEGRVVGRAQ